MLCEEFSPKDKVYVENWKFPERMKSFLKNQHHRFKFCPFSIFCLLNICYKLLLTAFFSHLIYHHLMFRIFLWFFSSYLKKIFFTKNSATSWNSPGPGYHFKLYRVIIWSNNYLLFTASNAYWINWVVSCQIPKKLFFQSKIWIFYISDKS